MNPDVIKIDDTEYVKKENITGKEILKDYVIVRTYSAGVFAGYLESREGQEVKLKNARRLWHWEGASTLSQLAMEGVSKPESCKFPCEVTEITLLQAIEIIPCTEIAKKSIKDVPIWKS